MNEVNYLIECIPNISEGRDESKINEIIAHISTPKVQILNVDIGYDANRTVITMIGGVVDVFATIRSLYHKTATIIDMAIHDGKHPRLGAVDICPFVPLDPNNVEDLKARVEVLSRELSLELSIPVFLYALSSIGIIKTLPHLRAGEYEALINSPEQMVYNADFGGSHLNQSFGGTVFGVRDFMIAYNININTNDLSVAKKIAKKMRNLRQKKGLYQDKDIRPLQIMGWYMETYGCCQISTNIHNPRTLSIADVYFFVAEISNHFEVETSSSELIGMIPGFAVNMANKSLVQKNIKKPLVQALGLDFNGPFQLTERIIPFSSIL